MPVFFIHTIYQCLGYIAPINRYTTHSIDSTLCCFSHACVKTIDIFYTCSNVIRLFFIYYSGTYAAFLKSIAALLN